MSTQESHGTRRRTALFATVALAALVATGTIAGEAGEPAFAVDYPSWTDVQNARNSESGKQAEVARITELLAQLGTSVAETQAAAIARGNEYAAAQQRFDEADFKAKRLRLQADEARATASKSKLQAGQLAARLARSGGGDVSASLFFDGKSAARLLSQLGMASKITDQSAGIYEQATRDQNTAQSLTDQADVAKDALQELAVAASAALDAATAAADAAAAALAEQQVNQAVLQTQLAVLTQNRAATEADFAVGEQVRAAAAAQAAAARAASAGSGSAPAGQIGSSGWARPASGHIASPYGYRVNPYTHRYALHAGTDIGAGCGAPIYAAHAGTVIYSGWNGGYGNFIQIANGDGTSTAYGHIVNGGLLVGRGQAVGVGQQIARVGSTGGSTGCHLHYEVRIGGGAIDAVPFMRDRGVPLG